MHLGYQVVLKQARDVTNVMPRPRWPLILDMVFGIRQVASRLEFLGAQPSISGVYAVRVTIRGVPVQASLRSVIRNRWLSGHVRLELSNLHGLHGMRDQHCIAQAFVGRSKKNVQIS
jgi:hypothetical protein